MIRLRTLLAAVPLVLVAACGSNSTSGSSGPGAGGNPASPATAPATSKVTLSETGSTLLNPLFNLWGPAYQAKYPNVTITAQGTGSGTGIAQAAAGTVDIGASDAYLSQGDMATHKGLMNIALAISAQQINYNLPGVSEHLKLNGKVLAAMYQGTIKTWNDPQIAALNPGVNLPGTAVVPLHRSDGSGDTFLFTQYLAKQDPDGWGKSPGFGTTVDFPAVPGALGENGNGGMVTGCAETPGCVAYIGISFLDHANQKGLGEAQLGNASGNYLLPDAQSIQAAAASFASQTPANQVISLIDGPAASGYPIVNYEYAIVNSNQKDAATAQTLQAFLHWAVTDGNNTSFLDQVHFQPLPAAVAKLSDAQIAKIAS
ncbi:periplasmic phosphate-binding lipoprotein PSTS1 [Mycobacterium haemophilum DSM 44634]|uniref:Phosphate-binding protein n=2 Tax=Mycobacterium haemophilum TaxID=29311 RepID=A0A0I9UGI6_9MYCO|nr:phosphate-binding protein [Mycobacterium haemophilum DSM 44634]KLO33625.1 phosphate-binding protein [Mycobacterium haemophilum]KLO39153.1 phosphate-binding protein [Mycobacterium haemophilum]KLO41741.1 phosphate-binding protein [Mycobacterium haemophilum]KLO49770.1 phosphate-binding protein [Mycobacterium haemophilum]